MIKIIEINEIEQLMQIITEQEWRENIGRNRSNYIYRGVPDARFKMETSLFRNCKDKQRVLEPAILNNFTKYAVLEDPSVEKSVWRQMILGQHHGLPTRLLDWTHSALVGLHFATSAGDFDRLSEHDSAVWRIDMHEVNSLLPEKYREAINAGTTSIFSVDVLNRVTDSLEEYDADMGDSAMVVIEPPSIEQRIVNQYSFFSIVPMGMENVEEFLDRYTEKTVKYIINRNLKWRIRDMLDQLNVSERIMYPGLDGLSKWMARHYFVKKETDN